MSNIADRRKRNKERSGLLEQNSRPVVPEKNIAYNRAIGAGMIRKYQERQGIVPDPMEMVLQADRMKAVVPGEGLPSEIDFFEQMKEPFGQLTGHLWSEKLEAYLAFVNYKMLEVILKGRNNE